VNFNNIICSLSLDTITEQNNSNDEMFDELVGETMLIVVYGPEMK